MDEIKVEIEESLDLDGGISELQSYIKCDIDEEQQIDLEPKKEFDCYNTDIYVPESIEETPGANEFLDGLSNINEYKYSSAKENECAYQVIKQEIDDQDDSIEAIFEEEREFVDNQESEDIVVHSIHNEGEIWNEDVKIVEQCSQQVTALAFDDLAENGAGQDLQQKKKTQRSNAFDECEIGDHVNSVWVKSEPSDSMVEDVSQIHNLEREARDLRVPDVARLLNLAENKHFIVKQFRCGSCDFRATEKEDLHAHVDAIHSDHKKFECLLCDFTTSTRYSLKRHVERMHLKVKKYKCSFCDYQTDCKTLVAEHVATVHSKEKLKCQMCDYKTYKKAYLTSHVNVHLKRNNFKCATCDYSTSRKSDLRKHLDTVHSEENNYKCSICDYRAKSTRCIETHENDVHLKRVKFQCELCDHRAPRKCDLRVHVDVVHLKLKNFKCNMCDYKSHKRNILEAHVNAVHLKLKKFKCKLCDYAASENYRVNRHFRAVHLKRMK